MSRQGQMLDLPPLIFRTGLDKFCREVSEQAGSARACALLGSASQRRLGTSLVYTNEYKENVFVNREACCKVIEAFFFIIYVFLAPRNRSCEHRSPPSWLCSFQPSAEGDRLSCQIESQLRSTLKASAAPRHPSPSITSPHDHVQQLQRHAKFPPPDTFSKGNDCGGGYCSRSRYLLRRTRILHVRMRCWCGLCCIPIC
ncbi:hypothetical protein SAICODRAFT_74037, partial [Saitoella complicata NRRL Y-17804]|uniref:uncharacterized protein n=1 Tax=Saitoella complicata (strain BCRC 22490 / CBS 7301 / JCM 7358 / NBRC 10748 / NRRL Y-17804) TaxID=698492 RepID=UPI000867D97E